jgi:L-threonylcarbamoyladenylate synthase
MEFETDIINCIKVLKKGGLILYPTDTIWGIGCDATNPDAVERVHRLKKRPDEKSMIVLVAEERQILRHVAQPDLAVFEYLKTRQKPTTLIYEGSIGLADNLVSKDGSIAIRICHEEFCKQLIKRFRTPIVSTSANISGEPYPKNFFAVSEQIKKGVDYVVQYRQNDASIDSPSTLVKWERGNAVILRP